MNEETTTEETPVDGATPEAGTEEVTPAANPMMGGETPAAEGTEEEAEEAPAA